MKLFMESNNKIKFTLIVGTVILTVLTIFSFFVGRYPLTLSGIISGDPRQWQVFVTWRQSRGIVGCIGGFVLGVAGFVFQTVFRNPLASPDIIGVSSGASAGAAFGILFLSGSMAVTASAFAGALGSVVLALMLASLTAGQDGRGIVLAGIAVHSLAQTTLIFLKLLADPEIKRRIAKLENERDAKLAEVTEGYRRLAFGSVADAVRLILSDELTDGSEIEKLDLTMVSDIKRPKGGGLEVKFFDRLKALDRLCELSNAASAGENSDFLCAGMMRVSKRKNNTFESFSEKQLRVLSWWCPSSPDRNFDAIICDGAVRSGKTLCMSVSFVAWAFSAFDDTSFALCGKTVTSFRRNIITPILPVLRRLGLPRKAVSASGGDRILRQAQPLLPLRGQG